MTLKLGLPKKDKDNRDNAKKNETKQRNSAELSTYTTCFNDQYRCITPK